MKQLSPILIKNNPYSVLDLHFLPIVGLDFVKS